MVARGLRLGLVCASFFGTRAALAAPFTVVTAESGVQALRDAKPADWWLSGLTFVDLDHDGDLDLFLSDHHDAGLAALNDGNGHFTLASGSYPTSEVHNCLDVDEDGKVDMDLTYADGGAKWWLNKTAAGSATLVLSDVGEVDTRGGNESREEALVDFNRDGKLDWVRSCQGQNFKVDFGDGTGKFTADSALIPQPEGGALDAGVLFADFDADGDVDLLVNWGGYGVPDDYGRVRLLLNDGQMNLLEKTSESGLKPQHLAILGAGDVDQDGDVDLIGFEDKKFPEVIYLNDGHGQFSPLANAVTGTPGSAEYSLWGLATVTDLDNDGIADILIDGRFFFHVLRGTGGGHFSYQNDDWGKITHLAEGSVDGGFAFGDLDADGDLDLMGFTAGDPNRQVELYRNDLPPQHWLNVRPVGLPGNKAATNSQIRIFEPGTSHLLWFEEVLAFSKQAQQNYYAFDQLERHYGLGARESVDVTVTFYPSGKTVRKNGVTADSTIVIGEDGTNGVVEPPKPMTPSGGASAGGSSTGGAPSSDAAANAGSAGAAPNSGSSAGNTGGGGEARATGGAASSSDAGCGCRFAASRSSGIGAALVSVLALWLFGRKRR
ncbi:MAG TPA: VCBS repeat-containing protein [Polyangiaceae bacterium]|nr:VCBS repeat-containing protein [Polyangiaceae bacterium]